MLRQINKSSVANSNTTKACVCICPQQNQTNLLNLFKNRRHCWPLPSPPVQQPIRTLITIQTSKHFFSTLTVEDELEAVTENKYI